MAADGAGDEVELHDATLWDLGRHATPLALAIVVHIAEGGLVVQSALRGVYEPKLLTDLLLRDAGP